MKSYKFAKSLAAIALICASSVSHASLILGGSIDESGSGIGNRKTILTLKSPDNTSTEAGSVSFDGTSDVITGDALEGGSQTQTRTFADLGLFGAKDLRIVFNANEPGGDARSITLANLVLNLFNPSGDLLFTSGTFKPITFDTKSSGTGNSGVVFLLDAEQAADAQLKAFTSPFYSSLNRVGLEATLTNATGGFETFFGLSVDTGGPGDEEVPEPGTTALLGLGLLGMGWIARRRKSRHS